MDNIETPINIYLELSKTFDTIDNILKTNLEYYGIKNTCLKFFDSYLTNRKHYVEFEEIKSKSNMLRYHNKGTPRIYPWTITIHYMYK